jgi:hypothetical protein
MMHRCQGAEQITLDFQFFASLGVLAALREKKLLI